MSNKEENTQVNNSEKKNIIKPDPMTSGERLARGYIATVAQEQKLREIWGEEFVEILIFNCNKIVEAEIGYMRLKSDPMDPQAVVNARKHLYRFRRAERVDTFMEMTELAMDSMGLKNYRELRAKLRLMPKVITSEEIWHFLESVYNPERSKHPMDNALTREEKEKAIAKVWGANRIEKLDNLILDESTNQLSTPELKERLPKLEDYVHARATVSANTRQVVLRKAYSLTKLKAKKHQMPYEEIPAYAEGIIAGIVPLEIHNQIQSLLERLGAP